MSLLFSIIVIFACLHCSLSFLAGNSKLSRVSLTMSDPPTPAPEWIGAKKFSQKDRYTKTIFSSEQISKILPHRYPFLLVDRVVEFEPGKRAVGIKCITANEPQFTGHFPDRPIMPGVLMIEAMAQLGKVVVVIPSSTLMTLSKGGIICLSPPVSEGDGQKLFFFTGVNGVRCGQNVFLFVSLKSLLSTSRWKSPVTPGDELIMEMSLVSFDDRLGFASMTGKAYVGGKVSTVIFVRTVLTNTPPTSQICVTVEEFTFALAR